MTGLLDELDAMKAQVDALRAENARLREALKLIAAGVDTFAINPSGLPDIVVEGGSRFAHEQDVLPLIYAARDVLYLDGQKERRAKALSELAEMDADLLDLDLGMKPVWPPAGCIRTDSCERHGECVYLGCVNQGKKAAPGVKP
jgi:hypothetical protein